MNLLKEKSLLLKVKHEVFKELMMKKYMLQNNKYFNIFTVVGSFIFFLLFVIFILPAESTKSLALGLEMSPDTSIYYTASRLYEIAFSYGAEGRRFYIHQRFTFDLIWPIVYGSFLFITSVYFYNLGKIHVKAFIWLYLPIIAVTFDYLENIMTALVMYRFPNETFLFDRLAGVMTLLKWITLSLSFGLLIVWIVLFLYNHFFGQKKLESNIKKDKSF